jgi:hypothetical protein
MKNCMSVKLGHSLKEGHILRVSEKNLLRRIFAAKTEEGV